MNDDVLDTSLANDHLGITSDLESYFKETAKWANFLAILGFVFMALMLVGGIFASFALSTAMSEFPQEMGAMGFMAGPFIGIMYAVLALIYFFPTLYLYRFAKNMKLAQRTGDQSAYAESFKNLKSMFKFMGIFMIVILGTYVLGIVAAIGFGITGVGGF